MEKLDVIETKEIDLTVREEKELYNPFDETFLSDEVISFLEERVKGSLGDVRLSIHAYCPLDEERLRRAFDRQFTEFLEEADREMRRSTMRQVRMFVIGIVFIMLWLIVSAVTGGIGPELLSIIGSFAMWEAANIFIVEKPKIRLERVFLERLNMAELVFDRLPDSSR